MIEHLLKINGFTLEDQGGGCFAYVKACGDTYILVTDETGVDVNFNGSYLAGVYTEHGDLSVQYTFIY
jgi:hypothetical protein